MKRYRTIVVDPPWELKIGEKRTMGNRGRWNDAKWEKINPLPYQQMTVEQIEQLEVPAARDAHLYLWTINKYVEDAYRVMRAWGFRPVTLLTWAKAPMGLGLGGTFANSAEFVLFGRRGSLPALGRVDRTWWTWKRGRHSQKPEAFQDIVESVSPGPYLEMFARRARPGWDVWGNEVTCDVDIRVRAAAVSVVRSA